MNATARAVLDFWFGDVLDSPEVVAARHATWFGRDSAFDERIRELFGDLPARALHAPLEAAFLYLPLVHAEDIEAQNRCVRLFAALAGRAPRSLRPQFESFLTFAIRRRDVIRRFGRFPRRNAILGRRSSSEEL